jgi:hypothetical protein
MKSRYKFKVIAFDSTGIKSWEHRMFFCGLRKRNGGISGFDKEDLFIYIYRMDKLKLLVGKLLPYVSQRSKTIEKQIPEIF